MRVIVFPLKNAAAVAIPEAVVGAPLLLVKLLFEELEPQAARIIPADAAVTPKVVKLRLSGLFLSTIDFLNITIAPLTCLTNAESDKAFAGPVVVSIKKNFRRY